MSYTLRDGRVNEPSGSSSSASCICGICSANITSLSLSNRQIHYDTHFNDEPQVATNETKASPSKLSNFFTPTRSAAQPNSRDRFWHSAQLPSSPPKNFVPGLIPFLKTQLSKSHSTGSTRRAVLCHERAVLVLRQSWDANWGCGYRNYLMACAALMDQQLQPMYFPLLDDPIPPSIFNLQRILEEAWSHGFDPEGARQLGHLVGTKKKLGVADIQVAFTYRNIPSRLVEFDLKDKGADVLINWSVEYFSQPHGIVDKESIRRPQTINDALRGAAAVTTTSRMPFILQHDGHSRTIVGYEVTKSGDINLLQFDPSQMLPDSMRAAGIALWEDHNKPASSKRPAASSFSRTPLKRSRVNENEVIEINDDDDDVLVLPSPKSVPKPDIRGEKISPGDVLKVFRLQPKRILRQRKYQVLYFPLTSPLTEVERRAQAANGYGEKIS
ncbi:hypothetical protein MIND_01069300 [Mycena indigotica]|uniref:UFSP1/2/DUB catalytic domain-containing protein n=1 Tax=Mycena indigotica TaxID=2126181 RepID=A0A8H6SCF1_9AGAR|nr:uncharacterized protein MIND_01069300 [Mycena indigotica]KAF7295300.1 hypothetical protein MIND_01069300 [Mycena indigotica]